MPRYGSVVFENRIHHKTLRSKLTKSSRGYMEHIIFFSINKEAQRCHKLSIEVQSMDGADLFFPAAEDTLRY